MTIFEYGHDIIIVDMGLQFPDEDMPGIDYIIPDVVHVMSDGKIIKSGPKELALELEAKGYAGFDEAAA